MAEDTVSRRSVLLIGGSAGSLEVIMVILQSLISRHWAIIVVLHRKWAAESSLVEVLAARSNYRVKEAEEKEIIEPATIYIAPADYHLLIEKDRTLSLDDSEKVNFSRPSIDVTFESAAEVFGSQAVAIILSGGSADGAGGLRKIKEAGGLAIVQEPSSADVDFMPRQVLATMEVDAQLHARDIGPYLNQLK